MRFLIQFKLNVWVSMVLSIQITKFKYYQYQMRAVMSNLMLAKVTHYTVLYSWIRELKKGQYPTQTNVMDFFLSTGIVNMILIYQAMVVDKTMFAECIPITKEFKR